MPPRIPVIWTDDREKLPWNIPGFKHVQNRLTTGDYAFKGLENYFRVERKRGWDEVLANLAKKSSAKRLWSEIDRLASLKNEFKATVAILVEDNPVTIPLTSLDFGSVYRRTSPVDMIYYFSAKSLNEFGVPVIPIGKGQIRDAFVNSFFNGFIRSVKNGTAHFKR